MNIGYIERKLIEKYSNREAIPRKDLLEFFKQFKPDLNNRTLGWRIWDLRKRNIIYPVAKGIYSLKCNKIEFTPPIDDKIIQLFETIYKNFHGLEIVVWNTNLINDLSLHQTFKVFYIVEAPFDLIESVFFKLKDIKNITPFFKPDEDYINRQVLNANEPVIVKTLITKSPIKKINKVNVPTIEKVLVDLFCDSKIFYMHQGNELLEIFNTALNKYMIDFSKLNTYAMRRNRDDEIKSFLKQYFSNFIEGIIE